MRNDRRKAGVLTPFIGTEYGHLKVRLAPQNKDHWVHRLVLLAFVGEPAAGQVARHRNGEANDNRLSNLVWGTPGENSGDMIAHGRSTRGERNTRSKLTRGDVLEIRSLVGRVPGKELAARFGVSAGTISDIKHLRNWGWLDA